MEKYTRKSWLQWLVLGSGVLITLIFPVLRETLHIWVEGEGVVNGWHRIADRPRLPPGRFVEEMLQGLFQVSKLLRRSRT